MVAVWRDIGKEFRVTDHSWVCSRHFKSSDYLTSLVGRKKKNSSAVCIFWKQGSLVRGSPECRRLVAKAVLKRSWYSSLPLVQAALKRCSPRGIFSWHTTCLLKPFSPLGKREWIVACVVGRFTCPQQPDWTFFESCKGRSVHITVF